MAEKIDTILQRIDGRQLSKLWLFYRNYFKSDAPCLDFIYNALKYAPIYSEQESEKLFLKYLENDDYIDPDEDFLIPLNMLNCVESLVSAAKDMDMIRRGEDVFKIVYLVTCVETLQKLRKKDDQKKKLLFDFFENYTSERNKSYIRNHFAHGAQGLYPDEDSFWQFVSVLNEWRNAAAHEGKFSKSCFKNHVGRKAYSILAKAQLDNNDKAAEHFFETSISYCKFEEIFVRACISFIQTYVASQFSNASS